jgi:hypothetical protein
MRLRLESFFHKSYVHEAQTRSNAPNAVIIASVSDAGSIKSPDGVVEYAIPADADTPRNINTPFSRGGMEVLEISLGIVFKFFNEQCQ